MEISKNKEGKRNGLITTLLVHACLLVLCFFLGFTYYVPPKGDVSIGFEALGVTDAGKNENPASSENVTKNPQEEQTPASTSSVAQEDEFVDQLESDVALQKSKNIKQDNSVKPQEKPKETKPVEKTKEVDDRLKQMGDLLKGPNNPGGSGTGGKDGNEGSEKGVPSGQGEGGNGTDGMFDFGGRQAVKPGNLRHDCGVRGSIKVRVKVDRNGKVIEANMVSGGTSFDTCLINKAVAAAKATKYTSNSDGPEFQEGIITLNFRVN